MLVNHDFSLPAQLVPAEYQWLRSPQSGVERVMLDRIGGEVARATSLVRYHPGSYFPRHEHPGGEEIFVLSGTFSDAGGDYPAGWYLRNPPGSSHCPSSKEGATIFVKLGQMPPSDTKTVRINTRDAASWLPLDGIMTCRLHATPHEQVALVRLQPGQPFFNFLPGGVELLVLEGELRRGTGYLPAGSWLRLATGSPLTLHAADSETLVWLKYGHLAQPVNAVMAR